MDISNSLSDFKKKYVNIEEKQTSLSIIDAGSR